MTSLGLVEVGLIDDHSMYRDGAAHWLESETGGAIQVVVAAETVDELIDSSDVSVVLLDLRLADGSDPLDNVSRLISAGRQVVIHSSTETVEAVRAMVNAGACGYVAKSAPLEDLVAAIRAAERGEPFFTQRLAFALLSDQPANRPVLSRREIDVLRGVAAGRTRAAVARSLGITEGTVKTYLERIRRKYHAAGRAASATVELYQRAAEDGLLQ